MPYIVIPAGDVDAKSPVSDALMGNIKNDLDVLLSIISARGGFTVKTSSGIYTPTTSKLLIIGLGGGGGGGGGGSAGAPTATNGANGGDTYFDTNTLKARGGIGGKAPAVVGVQGLGGTALTFSAATPSILKCGSLAGGPGLLATGGGYGAGQQGRIVVPNTLGDTGSHPANGVLNSGTGGGGGLQGTLGSTAISGGGGSAGEWAEWVYAVTAGTPYNFYIGAGGFRGNRSNPGSTATGDGGDGGTGLMMIMEIG